MATTPPPATSTPTSADEVSSTAPASAQESMPAAAVSVAVAHPVDAKPPISEDMEMDDKKSVVGVEDPITSTAVGKKDAEPAKARKLAVTVLLASGARHSFAMDKAYLARHQVSAAGAKSGEVLQDPFEMTVWQLKECIWKDWKEDWEQRPASALFIKLIQFGAYLDDRHVLKDCRLSPDAPNVIHMAIRPAEAGDDDATQRSTKGAFGRGGDRDGGGRSPSCRCVIM